MNDRLHDEGVFIILYTQHRSVYLFTCSYVVHCFHMGLKSHLSRLLLDSKPCVLVLLQQHSMCLLESLIFVMIKPAILQMSRMLFYCCWLKGNCTGFQNIQQKSVRAIKISTAIEMWIIFSSLRDLRFEKGMTDSWAVNRTTKIYSPSGVCKMHIIVGKHCTQINIITH